MYFNPYQHSTEIYDTSEFGIRPPVNLLKLFSFTHTKMKITYMRPGLFVQDKHYFRILDKMLYRR